MFKQSVIYFFAIIIGFLFVSFVGFWSNTHPPKIDVGQKPENFSLEARDIKLKTKDGLNLSAWYIPKKEKSEEDKSAIVILHGYPAEKSDMLSFAKAFSDDFSTLLLDMRYFGSSEGESSTLGCKEQLDVIFALDFLENKGYEKVGVMGFSLGGAVGIQAAEKDERINALVSYAAFSDITKLGKELYSFLPGINYPLVELMNGWGKVFFGCNFKKESPKNAAEKLRVPILVVHSKKDEQISFSHAEILKESLKNNNQAEFYFFEEGKHGYLPKDFNERLVEFFKKSL